MSVQDYLCRGAVCSERMNSLVDNNTSRLLYSSVPVLPLTHSTFASRVTTSHFITFKRNNPPLNLPADLQGTNILKSFILRTKVEGRVVPVRNWLSTTPWRHMGKWMYSSTFAWPWRYLEASSQLHAPAALPRGKSRSTHWIGGWMVLRAGLEDVEKILDPTGTRTPTLRSSNP
jgi:hypothetical protein